ncbi:MAG: hypothetical protein Q7Q73_07330 [Verrucomicrobiota bacterium JB024]|nr:hypothetical protein [Verrucomicrobiota bacterium JB024]
MIEDGGGYPSDQYKQPFTVICHEFPGYCKTDELKEHLEDYYSVRKHWKYEGGITQVRVWIRSALRDLEYMMDE